MNCLTEEQRRRMAENKKKALEKLANRKKENGSSSHMMGLPKNFVNIQGEKCNSLSNSCDLLKQMPKQNDIPMENAPKTNAFSSEFSLKHSSETSLSSISNGFLDGGCAKTGKIKSSSESQEKLIRAVCILLTPTRFFVDVFYHQQMIDVFKSIPSRNYDAKERKWNFAIEDHDKLIELLKKLPKNVIVLPLPKNIVKLFCKTLENESMSEIDISCLDPFLLNSLLPFQKEGVQFGIKHGGNVLIADDMGLGKTIQAIAIADYYRKDWPLLVVTPSSVRYSWAEAFRTWLPSLDQQEVSIINSGKDHVPNDRVIIITYDLLKNKIDELSRRKFSTFILDESHFLKNPKSNRTKVAQTLLKSAKHIIMLSGTPALSRPIELFTQISALKPRWFGNFIDFGIRYCNGKKMQWGWDFSGSSNMSELHLLLEETVMIRRLKSEVMTQLPPKSRQMVVLDPTHVISTSKTLAAMSKKMMKQNLKGMERRGVLLQYFHETGVSKLPAVCQYIKDLLESDHKFLCFAHHQLVLDGISEAIEKSKTDYIRIDGCTSSEHRKQFCDKFQLNENCRVALLSITAANAGMTLTAAQLVVFAELFWNPGILTQAEDRAHRIGQENSVVIQYLVAKGTADDHIWPLVQRKLDILNKAGLSKDNFSDADTLQARNSTQSMLEDFFDHELCNFPEELGDETVHSNILPAKRPKQC